MQRENIPSPMVRTFPLCRSLTKDKYYGKECKIEQLYQPNLMSLSEAETELQKVYNIINNMTKEHFLFVRAVTGLGKIELLNTLKIKNFK